MMYVLNFFEGRDIIHIETFKTANLIDALVWANAASDSFGRRFDYTLYTHKGDLISKYDANTKATTIAKAEK